MAGEGRYYRFHGAFGTKAKAMRKERAVDGFIQEFDRHPGDHRYVVMTDINAPITRRRKRGRRSTKTRRERIIMASKKRTPPRDSKGRFRKRKKAKKRRR